MRKTLCAIAALVLILMVSGCASSSGIPLETPPETGADSISVEVKPANTQFQASRMVGLLDADEADTLLDQKVSGFMEISTDESLGIDALHTSSESPLLLGTIQDAQEIPEPLIQPVPKPNNLAIAAVGSGLSEAEARSDALSSLSGILYSQVVSSTKTKDKISMINGFEVVNASSFAEDIVVSTNLPILGASYSAVPRVSYDPARKAMVYQVDVVMKASSSLPLYEGELESLSSKINGAEQTFPTDADSLVREDRLSLLLGQYTQFENLSYVARALGSDNIPVLKQSRYLIETQLRSLARVNDSYVKAAQNLTKAVDSQGVYVYPAKLNGSGGVTEFAEQLSYAMRVSLGSRSVSDPLRASYFLLGSYTLKDDGREGIYVTYRLEDGYGNVVSTSLAELLPSVYEGQRFIPVAYDFQKQLERGDSVDTGFSADIRMNGRKDYLSFQRGDDLTIEVKASAPCYFYVVGYVFNNLNEKFSYLFPLKLDAMGKDMFVYRVSPEDVNKWIIINPTYRGQVLPIEVTEPFGVEMLQVYASTEKEYQKFLDTVPGFKETKDYYMVSDNPEEGLRLTRALNIKKVAEQATEEIQRSEASVSFKSGR